MRRKPYHHESIDDRETEIQRDFLLAADINAMHDKIAALQSDLATTRMELQRQREVNVETAAARLAASLEARDLRTALAAAEKDAAVGRNYVADKEVEPREIRFANGRIVRIIGDGYLAVEMAK